MYAFDKKPEIKKNRKKTKKEIPVHYNPTQLCPIQRAGITISIKDGSGKHADGESGKNAETDTKMKKYPALYQEFNRSVGPEPINSDS